MDKAHALRAAQLEVANTIGCTQPWYWATFTLMGGLEVKEMRRRASMAEYDKEGYIWEQALTKAQRDLIKNTSYNNPWFWATYQLIGRWR